MSKNGSQHLQSLRDGRAVYIDGARVDDVTTHPAFRNAARSVAALYDFQSAPENQARLTFPSPTTGSRVHRLWLLPTTYAEMVERREAMEAWNELHYGFMGRGPDHVASTLCGWVMGIDLLQGHDPKRAAAVRDYFAYVRDHDHYVTYVIVNPQGDRSKATSDQGDEFHTVKIVDEDSSGITVKGAKMLGTGTAICNEVVVASLLPLKPGEEDYAITFAVPAGTKGLKQLCRRSYEAAAPSVFDYPLSSRFDENDAILYFDEVKVPWERVFALRDPVVCRGLFHTAPGHAMQNYQAMIRLSVKLRFLVGIARLVAETTGIVNFPQTREKLGQLVAELRMVEALVHALEADAERFGPYLAPRRNRVISSLVLAQQLYPRIMTAIRELAGGGMIMLPSHVRDFADPELAAIIRRTQRSSAFSPEDRVKAFKLAWDAVGSEFGSRHTTYEMFYAAPNITNQTMAFESYDWARSTGMVARCLGSYSLEEELKRAGPAS
ncbi:MAG: 4-hydroxyphenylacetate 3-monooxygenase [Betaproteobacteria bacterium]|nr:4-hydroxyphenylacetate 3-monooxygenase [Betaproteobacteria bacterium]